MKFGISAFTASLFVLFVAAPSPALADNIYLSWPGVAGSAVISTFPSKTGAISLKSYSQSVVNNGQRGIPAAIKPSCNVVSITKQTDSTSASFLKYTTDAVLIPKLTVTFTSPGMAMFSTIVPVTIVLLNVQMIRVTQAVDSSGGNVGALNDSISLSATTFEVIYTPQLADGTMESPQKIGWNCVTGSPVVF